MEQMFQRVKAKEKKKKRFVFKDKCLQHYPVGETKIKCKMISAHKEQ